MQLSLLKAVIILFQFTWEFDRMIYSTSAVHMFAACLFDYILLFKLHVFVMSPVA